MSRVFVRVYTNRKSVRDSHSFLVGSDQGGLSARLGSFILEAEEEKGLTLAGLRLRVQESSQGNMIRRTIMFEEALCTMRFAENPHKYPEDVRCQYRLALVEEGQDVPSLVPLVDESKGVYEVMNPVLHDLVLVPITQVHPQHDTLTAEP